MHRPPTIADEAIYWDLMLNHHAVTLSSNSAAVGYDTLTIVATPRNALGAPLDGLPTPQYMSSDPEHVVVTADGVLQAISPTVAPVAVSATLTHDNLKHVDTLWVQVADEPNPPALAALSVHPIPPDSAKSAVFAVPAAGQSASTGPLLVDTLPVRATTASGTPLPPPLVHFRSGDTTIITVGALSGNIVPRRLGTTTIYASTTLFGVTKADTLQYRAGAPILVTLQINKGTSKTYGLFGGPFLDTPLSEMTIGTGGLVSWRNRQNSIEDYEPVDFVFDDPDNVGSVHDSPLWDATPVFFGFSWAAITCDFQNFDCGSGSFVSSAEHFGNAERVFPVPGTYRFHSQKAGISGQIIVLDER